MTKRQIVNAIKKMDNKKIIQLWNEYVKEYDLGYRIYPNDSSTFDMFESPYEAVYGVIHGNYNENDEYMTIDDCLIVNSFGCWDSCYSPISVDALADWFIEQKEIAKKNIERIDKLLGNKD